MTESRTSQRDAQKATVYGVETVMYDLIDEATKMEVLTLVIGGQTIPVPIERKFADLGALQRYVDQVLSRVAADYKVGAKVTVRARKGNRQAHYECDTQVIAIPPHQSWARSWAMREMVALHEIAHHLTRNARQSHGPEFVAALLDLFEEFMGEEAAYMLQVLAREAGVKVG